MSQIPLSDAQAEQMMAKQQMQEEKKAAMEEQKENYLRAFVSMEGRERLTRIAQVKPQRAAAVEMHIIRGVQQGRLQPPISDEQVRELLTQLSEETDVSKNQIKIIRKNTDDDW
eukprot:gene8238-5759_t